MTIHDQVDGWGDGTLYGPPKEGAIEAMRELMKERAIGIFTVRQPELVAAWMSVYGPDLPCKVMEKGRTTHRKMGVIPITNEKLVADYYVDDHALRFTNWKDMAARLKEPKGTEQPIPGIGQILEMVEAARGGDTSKVLAAAAALAAQVGGEGHAKSASRITQALAGTVEEAPAKEIPMLLPAAPFMVPADSSPATSLVF